MPNFTVPTQPKLWKIVKATGGTTFIERGSKRFALPSDEDAVKEICDTLNRYERKVCRLENEYEEHINRS